MLPEQVSENWDFFAPLLARSLPPLANNKRIRMSNLLKSILLDDLVVWCYYDSQDNLKYVITTTIWEDKILLTRDLLIYTFTSIGESRPSELYRGLEVVKKYAKSMACTLLLAYVEDDRIKRFLGAIGGKFEYSLMQMELK